jgi:ATP phosphoribosyltransferase-like protein
MQTQVRSRVGSRHAASGPSPSLVTHAMASASAPPLLPPALALPARRARTRQAVLISNPHTTHASLVSKIKQRFEGYLTSSKFSLMTYNVPRTLLSKAILVTPGKRSPTVQQLEEDSWVSVSVMVETKQTSDVMDKLKELGATDILLVSLSNCRS